MLQQKLLAGNESQRRNLQHQGSTYSLVGSFVPLNFIEVCSRAHTLKHPLNKQLSVLLQHYPTYYTNCASANLKKTQTKQTARAELCIDKAMNHTWTAPNLQLAPKPTIKHNNTNPHRQRQMDISFTTKLSHFFS